MICRVCAGVFGIRKSDPLARRKPRREQWEKLWICTDDSYSIEKDDGVLMGVATQECLDAAARSSRVLNAGDLREAERSLGTLVTVEDGHCVKALGWLPGGKKRVSWDIRKGERGGCGSGLKLEER